MDDDEIILKNREFSTEMRLIKAFADDLSNRNLDRHWIIFGLQELKKHTDRAIELHKELNNELDKQLMEKK